jgi:hypothetical protein
MEAQNHTTPELKLNIRHGSCVFSSAVANGHFVIEIHVNTGNMYDIQVTNKTFIRNELCSGLKT